MDKASKTLSRPVEQTSDAPSLADLNFAEASSDSPANPADDLQSLHQRLAQLEADNQRLYEDNYALKERLNGARTLERDRAEFISNIAHELRSPLTSIKGYIDLILEGETGPVSDIQHKFLETVGLNTDKLAHIISDLLDVSRLESGRMTVELAVCDLRSLVGLAGETMRTQLEARHQTLNVTLPSLNNYLQVNADDDRLVQAFRILLGYACNFTKPGGTLSLELSVGDDSKTALVKVTSGGPSIPAAEIDKVFTKSWKSENAALRESSGSSMGLAIVRALIELHDGTVGVTPLPEQGNLFTIKLPLLKPTAMGKPEAADSAQTRMVLVVSQNAKFGELAHDMLSEGNFEVVVAEDKTEVFSDTPAWQPDLILEDRLPNDSQYLPQASRVVPVLHLCLSPLEQQLLTDGALAVLPWPAAESTTLDQLTQAIAADMNSAQLADFKKNQPVLLVSQANNNLRSLDKLLHDGGFSRVYRATTVPAALTLAHRWHPTLLVVDLSEGSDDEDVALFEALREEPALQDTPAIVLVAAHTILTPAGSAYERGVTSVKEDLRANNIVPKPFLRRRFLLLARKLATSF